MQKLAKFFLSFNFCRFYQWNECNTKAHPNRHKCCQNSISNICNFVWLGIHLDFVMANNTQICTHTNTHIQVLCISDVFFLMCYIVIHWHHLQINEVSFIRKAHFIRPKTKWHITEWVATNRSMDAFDDFDMMI